MTEAEWLSCNDARLMLGHHQWIDGQHPFVSKRKCRLFAEEVERLWQAQHDIIWNQYYSVSPPSNAYQLAIDIARVHDLPEDRPWIAALLRDIFGNPFRSLESLRSCPDCDNRPDTRVAPCEGSPLMKWLRWNDRTVPRLAEACYVERTAAGFLDVGRLAVLSDALEEAGCTDEQILAHGRGAGPHVRGCWLIDSLLGKS